MIDYSEIALRFGKRLALADGYMSPSKISDQAMMLAHHKGIADEDIDHFVRLFTCSYCFHVPERFSPAWSGHA
jgi:hypothetical protein